VSSSWPLCRRKCDPRPHAPAAKGVFGGAGLGNRAGGRCKTAGRNTPYARPPNRKDRSGRSGASHKMGTCKTRANGGTISPKITQTLFDARRAHLRRGAAKTATAANAENPQTRVLSTLMTCDATKHRTKDDRCKRCKT
jgi:hypothetical protein